MTDQILAPPERVCCPDCNRDVPPFRAAYWLCAACGHQAGACFACRRGGAYEYVDEVRRTHVCQVGDS